MKKAYGLVLFLLVVNIFKVSALSTITGTYMYFDFQRIPSGTVAGFNGNYYDIPAVNWDNNIYLGGGMYIANTTAAGYNGTTTGLGQKNAYSAAGSSGIAPNVYAVMPDGAFSLTLNTPDPLSYGNVTNRVGPTTGLTYDDRYYIPFVTASGDFNYMSTANAINAGMNALLSAKINNKTTLTGGVMFKVYTNNNRFGPPDHVFDAFITANTTTNVAFIIPSSVPVRAISIAFTGIVGDVDIDMISLYGITASYATTNPACILTASSTGITFNNLSTGSVTGYTWDFGPTAIPATTVTSSLSNPIVVFTSTGTKTISMTATGFGGIIKTVTGTVVISPPASVGIISITSNVICTNSPITVSVSGAVIAVQWERSTDDILYSPISGATANAYSTNLSSSFYFHAKVSNGGCVTYSGSRFFQVNSPAINYSYNAPLCAESGNALPSISAGTYTGGSFSVAGTALTINTFTGLLTFPNTVQGTFSARYTVSVPGCGMVTSLAGGSTFKVNSIPGMNFAYLSPICAATTLANRTVTGAFITTGIHTASAAATAAGLVIGSITGNWTFPRTVQGVFTNDYSVSVPGCGIVTSTVGVTINSVPGIIYSYNAPLCAADGLALANFTVDGSYTGGSFSVSGTAFSINTFTGTLAFPGTVQGNFSGRYAVSVPGCGMVSSLTGTFKINSVPGMNYTYLNPICAAATLANKSVTGSFITTGIFTPSAAATTAGLVLGSITGNWTFPRTVQGVFTNQYSISIPGCGMVTSTVGVTINSVPGIIYNYNAPLCATDGIDLANLTVDGGYAGGTFSTLTGTNISIDPLTGTLSFVNTVQATFTTKYSVSVPGCGIVTSVSGTYGTTVAGFKINSVPGMNYTYLNPICAAATLANKSITGAFITTGIFTPSAAATAAGLTLSGTGNWTFPRTVQGVFTNDYSISIPGCGMVTSTVGVTINSVPGIIYNYNAPLCAASGMALANLTVDGGYAGGAFSTLTGTNISIDPLTGALSFVNTVQATFTTKYSVSVPGCGMVTSTSGTNGNTITGFRINSVPGMNYTYLNPVCAATTLANKSVTGAFITTGTYTPSAAATAAGLTLSGTGNWTFPRTVQGVFTNDYSISIAGCGIVTSTVGVTITSVPGIIYNYNAPLCAADGMALPNLIVSGGYTGGIFSTLTGTNITIDPVTGTLGFVNTVQGSALFVTKYSVSVPGCGIVTSTSGTNGNTITGFRINSVPGMNYKYISPVCATAGTAVKTVTGAFITTGIYTPSAAAIAAGLTVSTVGTWNFSNSVQGLFTNQYSVSIAGCGIVTSTVGITINSVPGFNYSYTSPVCSSEGSAAPILDVTLPGAYFNALTSILPINSLTGVWTFPNTVQGNFRAKYNVSVPGCGIVSSIAGITINSVQSVSYNYPSPVCATSGSVSPILGSTLPGGYFTSTATGLSIDTVTGVWLFANTVQGVFVGQYSVSVPGCGTVTSVAGIVINSVPGVSYSYTGPFCASAGSAIPEITGTLPGGYFTVTASGLSIDPVSGVLSFPATAQGYYDSRYNISVPGCGLMSYATETKINTVPDLTFSYPNPVCAAERYKQPDISNLIGGGYFTTTAPGLTVNSFTGIMFFDNDIQGTFVSQYSIIIPGCGLITSTAGITINSVPAVNFSYSNTICATDGKASPVIVGTLPVGSFSTTATGLSLNSSTGEWTFANNVEGDFVAKYNFLVAGCGVVSSVAGIRINLVLSASVDISTAKDTICDGDGVIFTATGVKAGLDPVYIWRINNTSFPTQSPFFSSINLKDQDNVSVILKSSLSCLVQAADTSASIKFTVTPSRFVAPIIISGATEICEGDNLTYSVEPIAGASFVWTVPGEATLISGQGTSSISVLYNSLPAKGSGFSLIAKNQCAQSLPVQKMVMASTTCVPSFKITNLVTPNSSDDNRTWHIIGIDKYPNAEVKIYDSWGDLVFETSGYNNETNAWDGKYKGSHVATATYYYSIDLKDGSKIKVGYITVRE